MRLHRLIDDLGSMLMRTPLYWPVRKSRELLGRLSEAKDRWADRPQSLGLTKFTERFSVFTVRIVVNIGESGVRNLRRMPQTLDLPESEHRMAAYSAVMAAYKSWAIGRKDNFNLSDPAALQGFLEAAGFVVTPLGEGTSRWALSRSSPRLGERPEIMFNSSPEIRGTRNHQYSHELFHNASPVGGLLCLDGHAREILANRFAVEWANSLPGLIYSAETDATLALDRPFAFEEVMRLSSRSMFSITTPADGGDGRGSIVLQAKGGTVPWESQQTGPVPRSWDDLVLWSKPGRVDCFPQDISWNPRLMPTDAHGFVNFQTADGLYFFRPLAGDQWSALTDSGVVRPDDFAGLAQGQACFDLRDIPETTIQGQDSAIEGGRYLVLRMFRDVVMYRELRYRRAHQLFAVKDEDGCLYEAWEKAAHAAKPSWGPLLTPFDSHRHEHLAPFDNWWRANTDWREFAFDHWTGMITAKFMRDLTAEEQEKRQALEEEVIADARNGQLESDFRFKSV